MNTRPPLLTLRGIGKNFGPVEAERSKPAPQIEPGALLAALRKAGIVPVKTP